MTERSEVPMRLQAQGVVGWSGAAALVGLAVAACGGGGTMAGPPTATHLAFAAVSAGVTHTCGVTAAGAAYCWGGNVVGQLGDGTATDRLTPVLVAGGVKFAAVRASYDHTCGLTGADAAYCWGDNSFGQLGDGTTTLGRLTPVLVADGVSFAAVTGGENHTCGLTAAGAAYCWGSNGNGQLGDGTTTDRLTPVLVAGGVSFAAVSAGGYHTCGVAAAGPAYCWGSNHNGQLGDGTATGPQQCSDVFGPAACSTAPVVVAGGVSFAAVSAGENHTCGVTAAGATYCWGYNFHGQLGDGTTTDRWSPVLVASKVSFTAVSAGGYHTCGLTAAGAAYCWGYNAYGQLGYGITYDYWVPVPVVQ